MKVRISKTYIAIPPGGSIREQLRDRRITQKEFAIRMNISEKHLSRLINGEVHLTPEMAVRLETVLGIPAGFWLNLEMIYREDLVKADIQNGTGKDADILKLIPYGEMAKLGWVPDTSKTEERILNLRRYFEVAELSLLAQADLNHIACKRISMNRRADLALLSWAQKVKLESRKADIKPLTGKGPVSIPDVTRGHMTAEEVCNTLADKGICLVILPGLKGAGVKGVSFADGRRAVVGLVQTDDKKGFDIKDLCHELAHIALGHIYKAGEAGRKEEKEADEWVKRVTGTVL